MVGYVWCPVIEISGCPEESLPSVFSVGPGVSITYGTGTSTAIASATTVARPAMASVSERRDMLEDYALTTLLIPERCLQKLSKAPPSVLEPARRRTSL